MTANAKRRWSTRSAGRSCLDPLPGGFKPWIVLDGVILDLEWAGLALKSSDTNEVPSG